PLFARYDSTEEAPANSASARIERGSLSEWIDRRTPMDTWAPFFAASAGKVRAYSSAFRPDVIFSTSDPWSSHLLGYAAASAAPHAPWIADFRDPWTLCEVRSEGRPEWTRRIDRFLEGRILRDADMVT